MSIYNNNNITFSLILVYTRKSPFYVTCGTGGAQQLCYTLSFSPKIGLSMTNFLIKSTCDVGLSCREYGFTYKQQTKLVF